MNVVAMVTELLRQGVALVANGNQLVVDAPTFVATPDLRAYLTEHKPELLAELRRRAFREQVAIWLEQNAAQLGQLDHAGLGHDPGGFCATHRRWLSYPEQKRGACSWCVPVKAEVEPEYWASHWSRFTRREGAHAGDQVS